MRFLKHRLTILVLVTGLLTACSHGPTAPTPPIPSVVVPAAHLENVYGDAKTLLQADGSYQATASGINRGAGCATAIHGRLDVFTVIGGTTLASATWTLPGTATVQPGQSFNYDACCFTRDVTFTPQLLYASSFEWTDTPCR